VYPATFAEGFKRDSIFAETSPLFRLSFGGGFVYRRVNTVFRTFFPARMFSACADG